MNTKLKSNEQRLLWLIVIIHSFVLFYICDFNKVLETYPDELIYVNIAKCLSDGRKFTLHGIDKGFTNIAYSLLISPLWWVKNVALRAHLITALNSFLMSLSIIPVWLICKELQVRKHITYLIIFIIMIYPSMVMAATFMPENLYWPLTLFAYYFILRTIKYKKTSNAFIAGIISFLCYFCKEVGVCIFLSVMAWNFISPIESYLFEVKFSEDNKGHFAKYYVKHFEWKNFFTYISIYVLLYLIVNKLFLSTVSQAYGGVSGVLFSFVERIDLSKILYILYAIIFYMVYTLIAFFALPIIYPMLNIKSLSCTTRKIYFYSLILLMGTILTIVCTISINENLGEIIPRVHMRYFSSLVGLFLPIYGSTISTEKQITKNKAVWTSLGIFLVLVIFIFKGAVTGSAVDSPELGYAIYLHGKYGVMNIGELNVYIAGILYSAFLGIILVAGYLLGKKKLKYTYYCFYATTILICILNCQKSFGIIKNSYSISESYINDMKQINNYFKENVLENKNVLFLCNGGFDKHAKVYDLYFDGKQTYEVIYESFIETVKNTSSNSTFDHTFQESIYKTAFQLNNIDFFITEGTELKSLIGNLEYLENISSENFSVYRNTRPTEICYLNQAGVIDFTGNGYSTVTYNIEGTSVPEGTFSWTDGNMLLLSCDLPNEIKQVTAQININGTFNGTQNYTIYQNDILINEGSVSDNESITANLTVTDGKCSFKMALPNAISPHELGVSDDRRVLALAISSIQFIINE